jgi:hypothetical protein
VSRVLGFCAVLKIFNAVVCFNSVNVVDVETIGAIAYKSLCDKMMISFCASPCVGMEIYGEVPCCVDLGF